MGTRLKNLFIRIPECKLARIATNIQPSLTSCEVIFYLQSGVLGPYRKLRNITKLICLRQPGIISVMLRLLLWFY